MSIRYLSVIISVVLTSVMSMATLAQNAPMLIPSPPEIAAKAHFLIDAKSGKILAENNADQPLPPASLTKMMTSYIMSYEIARGNVKPTDKVKISKNAWAQNPVFQGSSLMWIEVGTEVSVEDLHRGVIISSGNDATVAIAEHLAGSEAAFADVMNQHAQVMGMTNTHFLNSHGLPADGHQTTARDLSILAKHIINDFPEDYKLYGERSFTFNGIRTPNRNSLLGGQLGVDGLKTGYTSISGYCLVTSAEKNGMRLISVVMGTESPRARQVESSKLLNYGFRFYETPQLYKAGEQLTEARLWGAKRNSVRLGIADDVFVTIPRGSRADLQANMTLDKVIKGAISEGQTLGELVVNLGDDNVVKLPVVALESIEEAGFLGRVFDAIKLFFMQLFGAI
ncbi:MAG TPA: D-alanyl-D-alanine carboxypeptidase family protein [Pseudomonadales bacterium]|nr:D-alanyl-D-alanine carboxypeptidase family protein [Pseudomonadales bacterium]